MFDTRTDRRGHRWSRFVAAPLGALALLGLAACGTGTDASAASGTGATTASAAGTDGGAASPTAQAGAPSDATIAAYRSCLEENGVTLPDRPAGRGSGGGTPPQGAGDTPPSGAPAPPADGEQGGAPGGKRGADGQAPPGVDAATWTAAQKACADLAPTPPDGGAGATGSGT